MKKVGTRRILLVMTVGSLAAVVGLAYAIISTDSTIVVSGILDRGVEAGCIILKGEDGRSYELYDPPNIPPFGSRVSVTGTVLHDVATICMQGIPLKVSNIVVVSRGALVTDYASLVDALRAAGAIVEPSGEVSQPFFSVKGRLITINGERVQVFEYKDASATDAEAALVSPDGYHIGTSIVDWVATPHFYKTTKLIVLYVGDEKAATDVLEALLGPQFAGG